MSAEGLSPSELAANWISDNYEWDRHGRGYINRKTGRLVMIYEVCAEYGKTQRAVALEEAERATGRDPKRCPECELSLQNGSCPMCGWKTARAAIASLRSELGSGPEGEER